MAYLDIAANDPLGLQARPMAREIRLGDAERRVILSARRDAQPGRAGSVLADSRLEALRRYAMLPCISASDSRRLLAPHFSLPERRIIDAMIGALPSRLQPVGPAAGRLIYAAAILMPLLPAVGAFSWVNVYLQDRLIAVVVGGLALLLVMPIAGAMVKPAPRRRAY